MVYPVLTNDEITTKSQQYNCFTRNGGNPIPKHAGPEAKGSNPTTGKFHGKKLDGFYLNDDIDVKKVSQFKYATWNIRGLGEK